MAELREQCEGRQYQHTIEPCSSLKPPLAAACMEEQLRVIGYETSVLCPVSTL